MSKEELNRLEVMKRLQEKQMNQRTAAEILGISVRQVKRLLRAYRRNGAGGLVSKQRGRPSHHQLAAGTVRAALDLLKGRYADFGPTLAHEKLVEQHGIELSLGSVRKIMIEEDIWKARKARRLAVHPMRERRACFGELVQMDGADHDWFEGRSERCTLLVMIDDATGKLGALSFVPEETFFGYCGLLKQYLGVHGRPVGLYTDKHGIFRVNIPNSSSGDNLTQFGRAMQELEIPILCANTPQAKGRVERVNLTLQDRLVKEMRLRGINNMRQGNAYLPEFLIDFNTRFAVQPRSSLDAHRSLANHQILDRILTWHEPRTISKSLTVQFKNVVYQIHTDRPAYALHNAKVLICQDAHGKVAILYKDAPLDYTIFHKQKRQAEIVSSKHLDRALLNQSKVHKPAPNHPWHRISSVPRSQSQNVPASDKRGHSNSIAKGDILIKP
jgi:transposase